jgi:ribose/xylose/arabinose/galactoside ABC-type transport system permease subunit
MSEDIISEQYVAKNSNPRYLQLITWVISDHLIWIILIGLCLIASPVQGFLSVRNIINVFWAAAPLGCMVLGMFFVMLASGLDLSLESIFGFAPAFAVLLMLNWLPGIVSPIIAIFVTLLAGVVLGGINGLISVKLKVNPFLVTLATMLFWRGVLVNWIPEGIYYLPDAFLFVGKARIGNIFPIAIIVLLALFIISYIITEKTSFGKSLYAIGNNETAAYIAGINIDKVKLSTFVIAGLFAAIGGLIDAGRISSVIADLGLGQIMQVFAAVILGGTSMSGGEGKISGIFASLLAMTIIDNVLNLIGTDPSIRQMVFGGILLGAIILASLQKRIRVAR